MKPTWEYEEDPVYGLSFGDIEVLEPKLISIRRVNKSLSATIKCVDGPIRYGFVSQDWVLWFLTKMKESYVVHLIVRDNRFTNGYAIDQFNFGPDCQYYAKHPSYSLRRTKTYLDNEKKFFFA